MAIDFTGVTNIFMGGNANSKTTSLQGVYHGENELWNHTDKGYRWRMMGNTYNGGDSFSVGDVVCFGYMTKSMWTNKDCLIPTNYSEKYNSSTNYVDISTTIKMGWSGEIGDDGKVIGWHLTYGDNLDFDKNMCSYAYRVAETLQNGAYARFQTNSENYLSTANISGLVKLMTLKAGVSSFWYTGGGYNAPADYYNCYIRERNTGDYIEGQKTAFYRNYWAYTTNSPSGYNVIFKRVKIAQ